MNETVKPVIDFHAHVLHPAVYAHTINKNVVSGFGARLMEERPTPKSPRWPLFSKMVIPEVQIADMDARGVSHSVIATSTVSQSTFFADPGLAAELDRQANEGIADWVRAHPDRFTGTFTLPLRDMGRALAELDYAVTHLGMRIVNLPASVAGKYLGDAFFARLWEEIERRGLASIIHPDGIKDPAFQDYSLWNAIGQGIEETRVMASLIYEGVLERHPDLKIVIAHAGGYLPTYIARLDRNATAHPASMKNISRKPSEYLRRFHYDTVTYDPLVIDILRQRIGADRILFGSDYPFGDADPLSLIASCGFDATTISAVTHDNAAALIASSYQNSDGARL
ncbi:MAG: amidohydrolase [Hyphomicrobiales bacterium]|nr:amidohydrolase [Hyphomicrobiales bacterium]